MIDAASFANQYNAFWSEVAPTLEHFVRRLNLEYIERDDVPLPISLSKRRAVLAEFAFAFFYENSRDVTHSLSNEKKSTLAWEHVTKNMAPYARQGVDLSTALSAAELEEARAITARLNRFFNGELRPLYVWPTLSGCGFVDASIADVVTSDTIFEVKTVDRNFRGTDIKQLITYAALNYASDQYLLRNIGVFNPRKGQYFIFPLDDVCIEISGQKTESLLSAIIQTISSGEVSR